MDFHSLKRRDLQILCKKNNIPANITNAAMADALASLDTVEGVEEFLGQSEAKDVSPERSVITSPNMLRTSTRHRVHTEGSECSKLATRTRCSTRRKALEGADSKQTPATQTTRRTAVREASIQRKIEENIQAEYEANLEQSQDSENKELLVDGCESVEEPKVSGVVDQEGHVSSEKQIESQDQKVVSEAQEVSSTETITANQKVDFHCLSRKELQNLCKRNKIPANITNAAMIDALEALESVEGLEDLLKQSNPLAAKSPEMSQMTSSRACQTRTSQRTTQRKPAQAGSALGKMSVHKTDDCVVQSLAQKMDSSMEDRECPVSISIDEDVLSKEVEKDGQSHLEAFPEKPEVSDCVSENDSGLGGESKSSSEKVSDDSDTSVVVETEKELQADVVENKFDEGEIEEFETESNPSDSNIDDGLNPAIDLTPDDALGQEESNLSEIEDTVQGDASENEGDEQEVEANYLEEISNTRSLESDIVSSDQPNVDEGGKLKSLLEEVSDDSDISDVPETIEEFQDDVAEYKFDGEEKDSFETEAIDPSMELVSEPVTDEKAADIFEQKESTISDTLSSDQPNVAEGDNIENLKQLVDTINEMDGIVFDDMSTADSNVLEVPKPISNSTTEDEGLVLDSASVQYSNEEQELSCLEINTDKDTMNEMDGIVFDDMSTADSNVLEVPKSISNSTTEDEGLVLDSASVQYSNEEQELSCLEINTDKESENCQEEVDKLLAASDTAVHICPVEKLEGSCTDDHMIKKFNSESTSQADERAPKLKGTPLNHKSLRKLKKMLKEKLEVRATALLTSKMENLTLEESEVPSDSNHADAELTQEEVSLDLKEGCEEIAGGHSTNVLGVDEAPLSEAVDHVDGSSENLAATQIQICIESVNPDPSNLKLEGSDESEKQSTELIPLKEVGITESDACLQFTPAKSSRKTAKPLLTPSKSLSKTTISAGRKNHALDTISNKENIDKSASKTGPVKTEMAVFESGKIMSSMSMGKLKKEFKVLQQQSEKKRPALQSRSENQCPLASP